MKYLPSSRTTLSQEIWWRMFCLLVVLRFFLGALPLLGLKWLTCSNSLTRVWVTYYVSFEKSVSTNLRKNMYPIAGENNIIWSDFRGVIIPSFWTMMNKHLKRTGRSVFLYFTFPLWKIFPIFKIKFFLSPRSNRKIGTCFKTATGRTISVALDMYL